MRFDIVVSTLPGHISGELLRQFLTDAHNHLSPGGCFYVVTVSHLREYIKRHFQEIFGNYRKLGQSKTCTVAVAARSQPTSARAE